MNNCKSEPCCCRKGYFDVLNYGGFLTRFSVNYLLYGKLYTLYSGVFAISEERRIDVPKLATNIDFFVEISPFPFIWSGVYRESYDTPAERCFLTYGVTFYPNCIPIPCTSPGILKSTLKNGIFIPTNLSNFNYDDYITNINNSYNNKNSLNFTK